MCLMCAQLLSRVLFRRDPSAPTSPRLPSQLPVAEAWPKGKEAIMFLNRIVEDSASMLCDSAAFSFQLAAAAEQLVQYLPLLHAQEDVKLHDPPHLPLARREELCSLDPELAYLLPSLVKRALSALAAADETRKRATDFVEAQQALDGQEDRPQVIGGPPALPRHAALCRHDADPPPPHATLSTLAPHTPPSTCSALLLPHLRVFPPCTCAPAPALPRHAAR